jgi:CsbD-like
VNTVGDGASGLEADRGDWKEAKGKIKQKWGQLTDDDLAQINGRRDQLGSIGRKDPAALRLGQGFGA